MQEPKLISPLLDDFDIGSPIKETSGVRCCPAMRKNTDSKYIVKIISTPSSQKQLDALLLTGAYSSADAAMEYFKSIAEGILEEVRTLQNLSQLEGFLPIEDCQMVAMDDAVGYDVYLLSEYRNTLAQQYRHGVMTHLGALNLGLDLCSALAVCRRLGYLYVDLKPENVYFTAENACRIGDIGFMHLDGLKYASLPERCRSAYTAPEIADAFSSVNTTVDIYALGLILYQAFNNGQLPAASANGEPFSAPDYADYEMAEIILKACHPNPEMRWQDPIEMGQALVSYMQRNGAHDTPIVPHMEIPEIQEETDKTEVVETASLCEDDDDFPKVEITNTSDENEAPVEAADTADDQLADTSEGDTLTADYDETAPEESDEEIEYDEVSAEVSDILTQADDLLAHPTPDPVIPPEAIDVPIPEPIQAPEQTDECASCAEEDTAESELEDGNDALGEEIVLDELDADEPIEEYVDDYLDEVPKKRKNRWIPIILAAIFGISAIICGILFYTNYYLQNIDSISLRMKDNGDITILITSQTDESKLSVICSDIYGNQQSQSVENGCASFTKLTPGTAYTVQIEIDGFHKLTGTTTASFTTPLQTNILQLQAATGNEDGSVVISFAIDGPDVKKWQLHYQSEDGHEQTISFAGHLYTINGLTVGTQYTFTLTPETNINYAGTNTVAHTVSNVVAAQNLQVMGWINGVLTAKWEAPEGIAVESWSVRCYNDKGFDQTIVVNEPSVSFTGTDNSNAYSIEVVAAGQSTSICAEIPADSFTVTNFKVDSSKENKLIVSWDDGGVKPEGGWCLVYSIDGAEAGKITSLDDNSAEIENPVPNASYTFSLQTADGGLALGGQQNYATEKATAFSGYGVTAEMMTFKMCKTPSKKNWSRTDLKETDYTNTFSVGTKASFLIRLKQSYKVSADKITTLFVIRDESGAVISTQSTTNTWKKMWYNGYCELDIPSLPAVAGNYNISIYFNGALAHHQSFTVK